MELRGLVEQSVFQQAFEHGAQARGAFVLEHPFAQCAPGQLHLVPRQVAWRYQGNHFGVFGSG
jgi:hypothetical protein